MGQFQKTVLTNGLTIVTEQHHDTQACAVGLWVDLGTRDEPKEFGGICHFLEHLVFKGTKSRSTYDIARSLEAYGGELNAYTSREVTVFHSLVLKENWLQALDVISDLALNMDLSRSDFELEKAVVHQEIVMSEDQHEELCFDEFLNCAYSKNPVSKPILGTEKTIKNITRKDILNFYQQNYHPGHFILGLTGDVDHSEVVRQAEKFFGRAKKKKLRKKRTAPHFKSFTRVVEKQSEQLHLLMGFPVGSFWGPFRFEAFLMSNLLGGGFSSKLYQQVREKKGLVYSIYSLLNTFEDGGILHIYAACQKENMKEVIREIFKSLARIQKQGVSKADLKLFKQQLRGSLMLGAEDLENRLQSIAVNELMFEKYKSVSEIISEVDKISVESMRKFLDRYLTAEQFGLLLLGGGASELKAWLKEFGTGELK